MKLICPQCGLKGRAPEILFEKMVKCPGCKAVFQLAGDVLVGGSPERRNVLVPDTGLMTETCSSCGFVLSSQYLSEIEGQLYCQVCLLSSERKKAA